MQERRGVLTNLWIADAAEPAQRQVEDVLNRMEIFVSEQAQAPLQRQGMDSSTIHVTI